MRPSVVLDMKRIAVREAVGRFRTTNPRVFGAVLPGATLFDAVRSGRPARRVGITARHSHRFRNDYGMES